jgi:hypothetical protein
MCRLGQLIIQPDQAPAHDHPTNTNAYVALQVHAA